jgi:nucleotide-binding universal stress UspA family protein
MLSPDAIAEMESDFDDIEQELRAQAAEQLSGSSVAWGLLRRQGVIAEELIAAATGLQEAGAAGAVVAIVVGSSSHATHRVVGSVAVSLARHSPVPVIIVP